MFIKGLKYEMKAVSRIVTPMLIVLLAAAMLMSATFMLDGRVFHFSDSFINADNETASWIGLAFMVAEIFIGLGLYLLVFAIMIAVFVMVVYRFYISFFTDEGYLTFTLPLTVNQHLWVKLVSMLIWNTLSAVATVLALVIILGGAQIGYGGVADVVFDMFSIYGELFSLLYDELGIGSFLVVIYAIVSYAMQSILIYFSISLGCMLVKKHRLLASIVSIFVVNTAVSTITSISSVLLMGASVASIVAYYAVMCISIVFTAVATIAAYLGTKHILERKLNLD